MDCCAAIQKVSTAHAQRPLAGPLAAAGRPVFDTLRDPGEGAGGFVNPSPARARVQGYTGRQGAIPRNAKAPGWAGALLTQSCTLTATAGDDHAYFKFKAGVCACVPLPEKKHGSVPLSYGGTTMANTPFSSLEELLESLKPLLERCPSEVSATDVGNAVRGYISRHVKQPAPRPCSDCGATFRSGYKNAKRCPECLQTRKEEAQCKSLEDRQRHFEYRHRKFEQGRLTPAGMYWHMLQIITEEECQKLAAMPYREFLQSKYWGIVRNYVRYKQDGKCKLCAATNNLNVHHRTYEHRGYEYKHLEDLILLCRNCHETFHDHREVN